MIFKKFVSFADLDQGARGKYISRQMLHDLLTKENFF